MAKGNYRFQNGVVVDASTVTLDNLEKMAAAFSESLDPTMLTMCGYDLKGYYHSSTKGWMKISQMNDTHLMNAALKSLKEDLENISKDHESKKSMRSLMNAILTIGQKGISESLLLEIQKRLSL